MEFRKFRDLWMIVMIRFYSYFAFKSKIRNSRKIPVLVWKCLNSTSCNNTTFMAYGNGKEPGRNVFVFIFNYIGLISMIAVLSVRLNMRKCVWFLCGWWWKMEASNAALFASGYKLVYSLCALKCWIFKTFFTNFISFCYPIIY